MNVALPFAKRRRHQFWDMLWVIGTSFNSWIGTLSMPRYLLTDVEMTWRGSASQRVHRLSWCQGSHGWVSFFRNLVIVFSSVFWVLWGVCWTSGRYWGTIWPSYELEGSGCLTYPRDGRSRKSSSCLLRSLWGDRERRRESPRPVVHAHAG